MFEADHIRILIADDHQLLRDGLKLLLSTFKEFEIVAMVENGEQAVSSYRRLRPDVVLMDLVMPQLDGPTATARILAEDSEAKVIVLTSFVDDEVVERAIAAGATGYLLKSASPDQLADAIRAAYRGRPTIDGEAAQALIRSSTKPRSPGYSLTGREQEVLSLLVEGKSNKEIAQALHLSPSTVRDYVSQILAKLDVSNRAEAAARAVRENLLS